MHLNLVSEILRSGLAPLPLTSSLVHSISLGLVITVVRTLSEVRINLCHLLHAPIYVYFIVLPGSLNDSADLASRSSLELIVTASILLNLFV